ncbi:hypothetical protein HDF26_003605 [Pedobacter cryoconitis]|uniref:hypothetical protein n=1 Tax=Pedobacter cryoconitis TaxID=188932 RepID=UPI00161BEF76|nr:hypothetical protein [Pedobacter cryoconitis]MBB6273145.1 hypothetical protein [Pedobacter cryoconitis]
MEKRLKIKELKKELLDLEGRPLQDDSKRSNNKIVSGFIIIAVCLVVMAIGIVNKLPISIILGFFGACYGVHLLLFGQNCLNDFKQIKRDREEKIIMIKKELLDLE